MLTNLASLFLRLGIGVMFMAHGAQKTFGAFGGAGIEGFSKALESMGFNPPLVWAYAAAYTELVAGLFLIIGLLVRLSSASLIIVMLVALIKVHMSKGFFLSAGGFEYIFIIVTACAALLFLGGGKFGITRKF